MFVPAPAFPSRRVLLRKLRAAAQSNLSVEKPYATLVYSLSVRKSGTTLMPESLLIGMSDADLRDFFAYLLKP